MKTVKIYQIKNTRECPYSFMSWDYAGGKFNMNDYNMVATIELDGDDIDILNKVWDDGNNRTLQKDFKMRSVSMSDIIEIDGKKNYVDTFGFVEVR